ITDRGFLDRLAVEQDLARVGGRKPRHHVDERRFAAAVRPEDGGEAPLGDVRVEGVVKRASRELLREPADRDIGLPRRSAACRDRQGISPHVHWIPFRQRRGTSASRRIPYVARVGYCVLLA